MRCTLKVYVVFVEIRNKARCRLRILAAAPYSYTISPFDRTTRTAAVTMPGFADTQLEPVKLISLEGTFSLPL